MAFPVGIPLPKKVRKRPHPKHHEEEQEEEEPEKPPVVVSELILVRCIFKSLIKGNANGTNR